MGDESVARSEGERKRRKGLLHGETIRDRASAWNARSILTTGDTEEYREIQGNTGKITD
jgi:hypothetical protein